MKSLLPILLSVALTGCATSRRSASTTLRAAPDTILPASRAGAVRFPELVKAYPIGRYVEPNNRRVMHEAHTIYRVESDSRWNLKQGVPGAVAAGPVQKVSDATRSDQLERDELLVELSRQKQATQAVMEGGRTVSDKLSEVVDALRRTKCVAEQNARLLREVEGTKARLESLEARLPAASPVSPQVVPKSEPRTDW